MSAPEPRAELVGSEAFTVFDAYSDAQDIALGRDGGR